VTDLPVHPAADLFPLLSDDELASLADDIRANGLIHPVVMCDGKVLDGRNRLRACALVGVAPRFEAYRGTSPTAYAWSANGKRRHLTPSQLAMVGGRMVPMLADEARGRQEASRAKPGEQILQAPANLREPAEPKHERTAAAEAAHLVNVSPRSVENASRVIRDGTPELVAAVDGGDVAVSAAADIARRPAEEQRAVIATDDKQAIKAAAKQIREQEKAVRHERERVRRTEAAAAAVAAGPTHAGIDLRCCDVADLVRDVRGAALVHADPNWQYDNQRLNGTAEKHYDVSAIGGIARLVNAAYDCALDDSYLLLWCTYPMLRDWFAASSGMRWAYVSGGAWAKTGGIGIGFHWRGDVEPLLLYAKGSPKPLGTISNAHVGPRSEHSEKPVAWQRDLLRTFSPPGGLVLDLYAGMAPLARACRTEGRRYVGAELDTLRHAEALALLAGAP
jgi:hypothetical protein